MRVVHPFSNHLNVRTVPRFSIRTLLIATAAGAILSFGIARLFVWPKVQAEAFIRNRPVQTQIELQRGGTRMTSDRITYCVGNYGVTEFGNIRIAVRGCTFSGESSSIISLANDHRTPGGGGGTGVGNSRFTAKGIPGGSRCTFGGLTFEITNGKLKLLDQQFAVDAKDRLILIDELGRIESISTIDP